MTSASGGTTDPGFAEPGRPVRPGLPVLMDLVGRPCLVVGGGPVAARKVASLVGAGALVTVVAPEIAEAIASPTPEPGATTDSEAGTVTIERRRYRAGEAAGYALVVTATGDGAVDDAVVADVLSVGGLVNRADGRHDGTVDLPAVLRRGRVTVAVSTGGASPALARWLRDRIAASLPPDLETVTALLDEARSELRATGRPTESVAWSTLLDHTLLPLVESGRIDDARAALRAALATDGAADGDHRRDAR